MARIFNVLAILSMVLSSQAALANEFMYDDIVQLIKDQKITALEALLPLLPEDLRSNYTLMHDSRSLQEANHKNPRVILFGQNAKLTCAFNGDSSQQGFDSLECFQFSEAERKFDFRQIQFPTPQNGLSQVQFSESNRTADGTTACGSCHGGTDPRPNWNTYSLWQGAYGADDDTLNDDGPGYNSFVAQRATHPRYHWLIQGTEPTDPYNQLAKLSHRPNLRFSDSVNRLNSLRTTRILESKVPRWQSLAFAVSALQCVPTQVQSDQMKKAGLDFAKDSNLDTIMAIVGVKPNSWTTRIFNDPPRFSQNFAWEHQSGYSFLSQDTAMAMVQEYARAGDAAFQKAIDIIATNVGAHYYSDKEQIEFFNGLNQIVPDIDNFSVNNTLVQNDICPELTAVFVREYLSSAATPKADSPSSHTTGF